MSKILLEGFDHLDLLNMVSPTISVDEYVAKMGTDDGIVTLAFTVKGEAAAEDLVDWFERGYDWVLDAQSSDGQVDKGKYLVFVELDRRRKVPERIIELIEDLETLTDLSVKDWRIILDGEEYKADAEVIARHLITSPHEYREIKQPEEEDDVDGDGDPEEEENIDAELNEMRTVAGIKTKKVYESQDPELRAFKTIAGL